MKLKISKSDIIIFGSIVVVMLCVLISGLQRQGHPEYKIEYKTVTVDNPRYRRVYWRVIPSELKWYGRIINPWIKVSNINEVFLDNTYFFSAEEYRELIENYHTFGEISERSWNLIWELDSLKKAETYGWEFE